MTENVVPLFGDRDANLPEAQLDVSHLGPQERAKPSGQALPASKAIQTTQAVANPTTPRRSAAVEKVGTARTADADRPVYQIELRPDDGLYPLPYMARQVDGRPWEEDCAGLSARGSVSALH